MAQTLAVMAVWAGLLGYVIPAAFSSAPTVSTAASPASAPSPQDTGTSGEGHGSRDGSAPKPAPGQQRRAGQAMVRVMQAALLPHRVSVSLGHHSLSHDQAFASITPYRSVRPGTWTVRAVGAGKRATTRVTLAAGSRTTLVVLIGHGHLVINAPAAPPGTRKVAAAAGPGPSTATSGPGRSRVPWLVLAGTGLLLALAGAARLRQLWWARRVAARIR